MLLIRIAKTTLATLVGITAVAMLSHATAHCQTPPGQLVQAVAKLNNAQLTFVRRLAEDPGFAQEFSTASASGNSGAAANLVSAATGMPTSSVSVSFGGYGRGDAEASAAREPNGFQLASLIRVSSRRNAAIQGTVCFNLIVIKGCVEFN